jgi:hypothetical protein
VKLTLAAGLFAAASAAAFAQAPAGSPQATSPQPSTQGRSASQNAQPSSRSAEQTVTGCLTSADNIYTLTVMDDKQAPGTTVSTTIYTLAPGTGVDLKPHVNQMITVKGTDAGPEMQNSARVVQTTPPSPAATGTSGAAGATTGTSGAAGASTGRSGATGATPTVQSTAKARINAKTLNITDVQPASGRCGEIK